MYFWIGIIIFGILIILYPTKVFLILWGIFVLFWIFVILGIFALKKMKEDIEKRQNPDHSSDTHEKDTKKIAQIWEYEVFEKWKK